MSAGRRRPAARWVAVAAAAVAAVGVGVGLLVAGSGPGGPAVVVADERGRQVASVPLPEDGRFALAYVHSVYRAEVTETFAVAGGSGFRLVEVASPSEAVLDYYELAGRRQAAGGWRRLEPAGSPRLEALPLLATEVGRRTLVVGDRRVALFEEGGDPTRLVLSVHR